MICNYNFTKTEVNYGDEKPTGYPSIDRPWLKYYSEEAKTAPFPNCRAYDLLYRGNKDHPSDIALNYYGRKIIYGRLFEEIENAAKAFWAAGVCCGNAVVVCMVNMPETVYAFYGLNRLGAIVNLVDPRTDEEGIRKYINECDAKIIMTVDLAYPIIKKAVVGSCAERIVVVSPAESLPKIKRIFYLKKNPPKQLEENAIRWNSFIDMGKQETPDYPPYEEDTCFIIAHTGGTTGEPKGVMLSDNNLNAVAHSYQYTMVPFKRQHKYFNDLPPFIVYGLSLAMHTTLCYGLQVILYPVFDSHGFPKQFVKYKPEHFSALTDHLTYLVQDSKIKKMNLSFLISAGVGGDSLNEKTEKEVNDFLKEHKCNYEVSKGYGMTELAATAVLAFTGANAIGSVGIPFVANNIKIMDIDTGKELGYNQTGEIWISGPSLMLGYYQKPEETAKVIVTDENETRFIKTGDIGYINEDGLLFHEGRIRRIYLTAVEGQPAKIFPSVVENVIKSCEGVYDCALVGRPMAGSAYYEGVAFIIRNRSNIDNAALVVKLQDLCRDKLPSYMQPVEYRFVDSFPHTANGKVDFKGLENE